VNVKTEAVAMMFGAERIDYVATRLSQIGVCYEGYVMADTSVNFVVGRRDADFLSAAMREALHVFPITEEELLFLVT
jgi:hypothetical protein